MSTRLTPFLPFAAYGLFWAVALFVWEGHTGLDLADEGYLWYGVQRTIAGAVPIRDFMSYDPGRYYISALPMALTGTHGLVALRVTLYGLIAAGLAVALRTMNRGRGWRDPVVAMAGAIVALWLVPSFKAYDSVASIALVAALAWLARAPSPKRYFAAGLVIGLAAVIGRNHGVYGVAGALIVMALLPRVVSLRERVQGIGLMALGVAVGFMPMLLMMAFTPGFAASVYDSIAYMFEVGSTNIPLPMPWPWLVQGQPHPLIYGLSGCLFLLLPLFGIGGVALCAWRSFRGRDVDPVLLASAALSLPYAHYALSRADMVHLALGAFPFLIGVLALLETWPRRIYASMGAAALLAVSVLIVLPLHPGQQCRKNCVKTIVAGDRLKIQNYSQRNLEIVDDLRRRYAADGREFLVLPNLTGIYAATQTQSPVWETYALLPRNAAFQQTEIAEIEHAHPGFILRNNQKPDGRDDLDFVNSHKAVNDYIVSHYSPVENIPFGPAVYHVYTAKP